MSKGLVRRRSVAGSRSFAGMDGSDAGDGGREPLAEVAGFGGESLKAVVCHRRLPKFRVPTTVHGRNLRA